MSVTVQSFFLAVGSIVASSSTLDNSAQDGLEKVLVLSVLLFIGLFHIRYIWIEALIARHKIVDFYKFQVERDLSDKEIQELESQCNEYEYVNDDRKRRDINDKFFKRPFLSVLRTTRFKMDITVPFYYALIWVVLWVWACVPILLKLQ